MHPALDPAFSGPFDRFRGMVAGPEDTRPAVSARALIADEDLGEMMIRRAGGSAAAPAARRGAASLWSQFYFAIIAVPVVAGAMLAGRRLAVGLDDVRWVIGDNGLPVAMRLDDPGAALPDRDPLGVIVELIENHMTPLVDTVSRTARLAPRLLWCNAAVRLIWAMETAALTVNDTAANDTADIASIAQATRRLLIEAPTLPSGAANPMFDMLLQPSSGATASYARKVCCLRYLMPGVADCGETCPLPPRNCG